MTEPLKLVERAKASDAIRDSVVALLRDTLAEAERGEINFVALVFGRPNGHWSPRISGSENLPEAIGRIECATQEWIMDYLKHAGDA